MMRTRKGAATTCRTCPFNSRILPCGRRRKAVTGAQDEDLAFWKKQLAGIPEELEIQRDRPRPSLQTYAGDACGITVR